MKLPMTPTKWFDMQNMTFVPRNNVQQALDFCFNT